MRAVLVENLDTLIVVLGFVALEAGIAYQWSGAIAAIVGGSVLMCGGGGPYLVRAWITARTRTR